MVSILKNSLKLRLIFFKICFSKDGNASITSYVVEMKSKIGDWVEVMETDGPQTQCKVEGLKEGEQVRFRIKAKNKGKKIHLVLIKLEF